MSCLKSAGSCLNDQAILLEYNTLIGVYQIGVNSLVSFFGSHERPLMDNYVQCVMDLETLIKYLISIFLSKPFSCLRIKALLFATFISHLYISPIPRQAAGGTSGRLTPAH